jgi:hypothetical protein
MAEKLGMDPVEFRIVNDTKVVPDNPSRAPSEDPQSVNQEQRGAKIQASRFRNANSSSAFGRGQNASAGAVEKASLLSSATAVG